MKGSKDDAVHWLGAGHSLGINLIITLTASSLGHIEWAIAILVPI